MKSVTAPQLLSHATIAATLLSSGASLAKTHQAICSFYTRYEPCTVTIGRDYINANLPTDFLEVTPENYININIYKDIGKESNYVLGTATTILFGPVGLLGFLAQKNYGTIDYGVEFKNDRGKKKTAFIRFVNLRAADDFGKDLTTFLKNMPNKNKQQ